MRKQDGVSIICLVYNHEKYLRNCLDGFVNQKTDFPVEVFVHDDCSTDSSVSIIMEYKEKYPDIIIPVLEKENQFSKGLDFIAELFRRCEGKYIACCEGDDYWNDPLKIQKQYDFMESHPECSMCVHNSVVHDLKEESPDSTFFKAFEDTYRIMSPKQVFDDWMVHASSYFYRNNHEIYPEWCLDYFSGDYALLSVAYAYGSIGVLPDAMSVYNYQNTDGLTYKNTSSTDIICKIRQRKSFLEKYLKHFSIDEEAVDVINSRMNAIEESCTAAELCIEILQMKNRPISDEEKFSWLQEQLNSDVIFKWCIEPSDGVENRMGAVSRSTFFSSVDELLETLLEIKNVIHFSFVPWMSKAFGDSISEKEYIYGIASHPDNHVGWGLKVSGSANERRAKIALYLQNELSDENKLQELEAYKALALEQFDVGDFEACLGEIDKALDIYPLDQTLLLYKAFVLSNVTKYDDALDEVGIYSLFYGMDQDAEELYKSIVSMIG